MLTNIMNIDCLIAQKWYDEDMEKSLNDFLDTEKKPEGFFSSIFTWATDWAKYMNLVWDIPFYKSEFINLNIKWLADEMIEKVKKSGGAINKDDLFTLHNTLNDLFTKSLKHEWASDFFKLDAWRIKNIEKKKEIIQDKERKIEIIERLNWLKKVWDNPLWLFKQFGFNSYNRVLSNKFTKESFARSIWVNPSKIDNDRYKTFINVLWMWGWNSKNIDKFTRWNITSTFLAGLQLLTSPFFYTALWTVNSVWLYPLLKSIDPTLKRTARKNKDITRKLMREHWFLLDAHEIKFLNWPKWIKEKAEWLKQKLWFPYFYNVTEISMKNKLWDIIINQVAKEMGYWSVKWMDNDLTLVKKRWETEYKRLVSTISNRIDDAFYKFTAWDIKTDREIFRTKAWRIWHFALSFLGKRWQSQFWHKIDLVKNFSKNTKYFNKTKYSNEYKRILQEQWFESAQKFADDFFNSNEDMIRAVAWLLHSFKYWMRIESVLYDKSDIDMDINDIMFMSYVFQMVETIPAWRIGKKVSNHLYEYATGKHQSPDETKYRLWDSWAMVLKEISRRRNILRGFPAVAWYISEWWSALDWLSKWREHAVWISRAYTYYLSNDMDRSWFEYWFPKTSEDVLSSLWIQSPFKKAFRELNSEKTSMLLDSLDNASIPLNNLKYKIVWLSDFIIWGWANNNIGQVRKKALREDINYAKVVSWERPENWSEFWLWMFLYKNMTELSDYNADDWENARKQFFYTKDWERKQGPRHRELQWQEDLFVDLLFDKLENWWLIEQIIMSVDERSQKESLQIQAFLKWIEDNIPWSAKEVLWYTMWKEYQKLFNENKLYNVKKDDEDLYREMSAQIKEYLWKKYRWLIYNIDKPTAVQADMFYLYNSNDDAKKYLLNPYTEKEDWTKYLTKQMAVKYPEVGWDEWDEWVDVYTTALYKADAYADIELSQWNVNGIKATNIFSTLLYPKWNDYYNKNLSEDFLFFLNRMLDKTEKLWVSTQDEVTIASSLFKAVWADKLFEMNRLIKNWEVNDTVKTAFNDTLSFLWSYSNKQDEVEDSFDNKQVRDTWLNLVLKDWKKAWIQSEKNYTTSYSNDWYTLNDTLSSDYVKNYQMNKVVYDALRDLKDKFHLFNYNNNYVRNDYYKQPTYSKKERDYLQEVWKMKDKFMSRYRNYWAKKWSSWRAPEKDKATRSSKQKQWFAMPQWLKHLPRRAKETDRTTQWIVKRPYKRKFVDYSPEKARGAVMEWWVSDIFSKRGFSVSHFSMTEMTDNRGPKD